MNEEEMKRMIDELLGKLSMGGGTGSLLSGFDTPAMRDASLMGGGDDGFLPGGPANTSAFSEKMDWIQNNPNLTTEEKQQIGIIPTAWQEKMQYIRDNPNKFDVGLGIDGKDYGYTFTGDGGLSEVGLAEFRRRNNITANTGGGSDNLGFGQYQTDLQSDFVGGFERGIDTPAQRHSIEEIMGNLNPQEQNKVKMILSNMTPEQQEIFLNGMMDGSINPGGYGVQNEQILY